jgi:Zn-dependent oligopeptidase
MSKGDNEKDNKATLVQILQLRAKAKFGFPTFAHWNLSNKIKHLSAQWS